METPKYVVNVEDVKPLEMSRGKFAITSRRLAGAAGAQKLGCSVWEIAPGKTSFPTHWHAANEEGLFVLSGTGEARIGGVPHPIRAGDYVAFPVGPEHAHQVVNTGAETLRFLGISTALLPEVVGYPDSQKLVARTTVPVPGAPPAAGTGGIFKLASNVDYWDGET